MTCMLEAFVAGPVFHMDGFTAGQELLYLSVSRYINDCLSFNESLPLGSVQLDRDSEDFRLAESFTAKVLRALPPVGFSPFHLEAFRRPDGELVFCEIACRLGGAHVVQALTYATGVNPARLWIRHQAGLADGPETARELADADGRYGWLLIPPRPGRLLEVREPLWPALHQGLLRQHPRSARILRGDGERGLGHVIRAPRAGQRRPDPECAPLRPAGIRAVPVGGGRWPERTGT